MVNRLHEKCVSKALRNTLCLRFIFAFWIHEMDTAGSCAQLNWSWEVPCQCGHWHQMWTFQRNGLSHYSYPTPIKEQQDLHVSLHSSHHWHVGVFMHIYFESVCLSLQVADPHLVPWTLLRCSHHSLKKKTQDVSLHSSHHCQVCVFMHVSILSLFFSPPIESHVAEHSSLSLHLAIIGTYCNTAFCTFCEILPLHSGSAIAISCIYWDNH